MNDLIRCLYRFVCEKRMGNLCTDEEYMEISLSIEQQQKRVEAYLSKEQQRELHTLMERVMAQGDITGEYLFQAALSLSRELDELAQR